MKVLITGGMGVIGAETSRKFVKEGHRPVIYARHRDDSLIARHRSTRSTSSSATCIDMPRLLDVIKTASRSPISCTPRPSSARCRRPIRRSASRSTSWARSTCWRRRALFDVKRVVYTSAKGVYGPVLGEYGSPDLQADARRHAEEPQAHLRFREAHGRAPMHLLSAATWASTRWCCASPRPTVPGKTARHGRMGVTSQIVEAPGERPAVPHSRRAATRRTTSSTTRTPRSASISPPSPTIRKSRVYNIGTGVGAHAAAISQRVLRRHMPHAVIEIGPGLEFPRHAISGDWRVRHLAGARGARLCAGIRSGDAASPIISASLKQLGSKARHKHA